MDDSSVAYEELLQRLEQGDATARAALIERSQERLRLRVSQMLGRFPGVRRVHATSDVLQEVLLDLSGTLSRITPRNVRHFLGLAGQRIRWKLLDLARRPVEAYQRGDGELAEAIETTHDPARLAEWAEIHSYIQGLPEAERELFDLIFYQGVPQPVVARMLGIGYRTLKHRWQDARLRFMARFDGTVFG
jgi:RNA polymerase sigma factor (sigma-70 family)